MGELGAAPRAFLADPPPQFEGHIRFTLIAAAIARVDDPEGLLPAAPAVAGIAGHYTVDFDWGPLLRAFTGHPEALPAAP